MEMIERMRSTGCFAHFAGLLPSFFEKRERKGVLVEMTNEK